MLLSLETLECTILTSASQPGSIEWIGVKEDRAELFGRRVEMETCRDYYTDYKADYEGIVSVVTGPGGVGKTKLVTNFLSMDTIFKKVNCMWLNCKSNDCFLNSLKLCETMLKMRVEPKKDSFERFKDIWNEINHGKQIHNEFILVLDGLEHIHATFRSIVMFANIVRIFTIITSKNERIYDTFNLLRIGLLSTPDAEKYVESTFKKMTKQDSQVPPLAEIKLLCETMCCFPLALQQAVTTIIIKQKRNSLREKYGIQEFLNSWDEKGLKLFEKPASKVGLTDEDVLQCMNASISQIKHVSQDISSHPSPYEILVIISWLHCNNILISFLLKVLRNFYEFEEKVFRKNLKVLFKYSLPESNGVLSVLPLPQLSVPRSDTWQNHDVDLMQRNMARFLQNVDIDKADEFEIRHLESIWRLGIEYFYNQVHLDGKAQEIFERLKFLSLFQIALYFAQHCESFLKSAKGINNLQSLEMIENKASVMLSMGDIKVAMEILEKVLIARLAERGKDARYYDTLHLLGVGYGLSKNYEKALSLYEEVCKARSSDPELGFNHDKTLLTRRNIAIVLKRLGDFDRSDKILIEILAARKNMPKTYESDSLFVKYLMVMHSLGHNEFEQKLHVKAFSRFDEVLRLADDREICVNKNDLLLSTRYMIGRSLEALRKNEDAIEELKETLACQSAILPVGHVDVEKTKYKIYELEKQNRDCVQVIARLQLLDIVICHGNNEIINVPGPPAFKSREPVSW